MECNAKTARAIVEFAIDNGIVPMVSGAPGIGKTAVISQIAKDRGIGFIALILSQIESADLKGLPHIQNGKVNFAPLGELPNDGNGILFLDELTQAQMSVQNAAMTLILDRKIGEYQLPDGWQIVAAGNRASDRAGSGRLNSALANRMMHIDFTVSVDDWCHWAIANNAPAELVAFIRFRPAMLHDFNPDRLVNATPRTWGNVAKALKAGIPADLEMPLLSGIVGEGPAIELLSFLRIWRNLPNPDAVLMNPDTAEIPKDGATLYALCGALARKVTIRTIGNFCKYASRLPSEYGVLLVKDATRRDESLSKTPEMVTFLALNSDVYL